MSLRIEFPAIGAESRLELERRPDAGGGIVFPGRWPCFHRPAGWRGFRSVSDDTVYTEFDRSHSPWVRDGGLILVYFPGGGRRQEVARAGVPRGQTRVVRPRVRGRSVRAGRRAVGAVRAAARAGRSGAAGRGRGEAVGAVRAGRVAAAVGAVRPGVGEEHGPGQVVELLVGELVEVGRVGGRVGP